MLLFILAFVPLASPYACRRPKDVDHEDVASGCGDFSLRSFNQGPSAFYVIQLQGLGARVISVAATGEKKRSPCAPPLMLFAPGQGPSAFYCISISFLDNDTVSEIRVSSFLFG